MTDIEGTEKRCLCGSNSPVYCTFGELPKGCLFVGRQQASRVRRPAPEDTEKPDACRAAFEKWAKPYLWYNARDRDSYAGDLDSLAWMTWQAAWNTRALPALTPEAEADIVELMAKAMTDGLDAAGWPRLHAQEALRAILSKYKLVEKRDEKS